MAYKDLSLKERHAIIRESVSRGIHRLSEIEAMYDASHAMPEQQIAVAPVEAAPQEVDINTQPNLLAEGGGIHIKPSKRGTFTAAATKHGKSVQAFASQVLAHKENYSPAMVKKANFARNASHWHGEGGDTTKVYSNYMDAIDAPKDVLGKLWLLGRMFARRQQDRGINPFGSGISNCTLSATQWVDPNNPIMSAKTIVSNPTAHGYIPISVEDAIPGDLIIASNKQDNAFHSMYIDGFDAENNPIVRYSRGAGVPSSLVSGITLGEYHKRDNGKHEKDNYYRYVENGIPLPEVTVTPNKKSTGGPLYPFSFSKAPLPRVRY